MMGRSHSLCGLTLGATAAALLHYAPLPIRALVIPVAGAAALLPDGDTPQSRIARSLGPITLLLALAIAWLSRFVYHWTRTDRDSSYDNGGHRRLTHTIPGCLFFGTVVLAAVLTHPIAGATALALLIGLLAQGFRAIGFGFTAAGGVLAWYVMTSYPTWWWLWPAVVAAGGFVHILGDTVTNSGTPMLWPFVKRGKRWATVRAWTTFSTGSDYEKGPVTRRLWVAFIAAMAFATGAAQLTIGALAALGIAWLAFAVLAAAAMWWFAWVVI